jgi:hypothetical protein
VELHSAISDAEHLRELALSELLKLVIRRLGEKGVAGPVRADAFLAAIDAAGRSDLEPTISGWAAQLAAEGAENAGTAAKEFEPDPLAAAEAAAGQGEHAPPDVLSAAEVSAAEPSLELDAPGLAIAAEVAPPRHSITEPGWAVTEAPEAAGDVFGAEGRATASVGGPPSGVLDLAALTRDVTAAGALPDQPPVPQPAAEPELTLLALEPEWLADEPGPAGPGEPPVLKLAEEVAEETPAVPAGLQEPLSLDDAYPIAIPVGDWLTDEEPARAGPQPPPLPADARARLAKMTTPPTPAALQTPLPPESA